MSMRSFFQRRSAVITGGSSGIGLALAHRLVDLGASVTLIARRPGPLAEAKSALESKAVGALVHTLELDVSDPTAVSERLGAHLADHPADMLVNNAGVVMPGRFVDLPMKEFRQMMDINFFGVVHMCRAAMPSLTERASASGRPSVILNISSLAGYIGIYGYTAYAASKFALRGFSEALRAELWPDRLQVSVCFPPDTDTPQLAFENQYKPAETKAIAGQIKPLTADDVADASLKGVARGRFEIIPGASAYGSALAQRLVPGLVRMSCDRAQKRAQS
jgi:3-dehydrosphinganine reductase